jgi:hypothetical protein
MFKKNKHKILHIIFSLIAIFLLIAICFVIFIDYTETWNLQSSKTGNVLSYNPETEIVIYEINKEIVTFDLSFYSKNEIPDTITYSDENIVVIDNWLNSYECKYFDSYHLQINESVINI